MTKLSFLTCEKYKVSTLGQIETTSAVIHNLFLIPSHKIRLVDNLVDECQLELNRSKFLPFLEKNGDYWGLPSDTAVAIRELKRMRRQLGCSFIAFAWPCFWWLEHYSGFAKYLQLNFTCVLEDDLLIVFDLHSPE